jgi:hypothetical protein
MAPLCIVLSDRHKYDVPDLNKGPSHGSGPPLTTASAQRKTTYLEHDFGDQASHIAQRYAMHEWPSWMYTPVYRRLDALRSLGTKGHGKGLDQGISLPLANTRTWALAQAQRRQLPAENNKLFAEQARGERGDARRDVSRMLVFGA